MLGILPYVSGPCVCPAGDVSVQVLRPFFNLVVCVPGVELCEFFIYFGNETLVQSIIENIFSHTVGSLFFFFFLFFFIHTKVFYFDKVPFVYFFLYVPCFRGHIGENIAAWNI